MQNSDSALFCFVCTREYPFYVIKKTEIMCIKSTRKKAGKGKIKIKFVITDGQWSYQLHIEILFHLFFFCHRSIFSIVQFGFIDVTAAATRCPIIFQLWLIQMLLTHFIFVYHLFFCSFHTLFKSQSKSVNTWKLWAIWLPINFECLCCTHHIVWVHISIWHAAAKGKLLAALKWRKIPISVFMFKFVSKKWNVIRISLTAYCY